jgi:hypothetical protein
MTDDLSKLHDAEVTIVSAYLKESALCQLAEHINSSNQVSIVTRWQAADLLSGSSDLSAYKFAADHSWPFFARLDLHAKLYQIGNQSIYIGSANLTARGYGLNNNSGNAEGMVKVLATECNVATVKEFFSRAVRIDSATFERLSAWVESHPTLETGSDLEADGYPLSEPHLDREFEEITSLMVSECFHSDGSFLCCPNNDSSTKADDAIVHDLSLLGMRKLDSFKQLHLEDVAKRFRQTRAFNWLANILNNSSDGEMYFGELTAVLDQVLADDPKPYRKSIKVLLANLLAWVQVLPETGMEVDRPRFSQRVFLSKDRYIDNNHMLIRDVNKM